jgi:hypothetical protein
MAERIDHGGMKRDTEHEIERPGKIPVVQALPVAGFHRALRLWFMFKQA